MINFDKALIPEKSFEYFSSVSDTEVFVADSGMCSFGVTNNRQLIAYVLFTVGKESSEIQSISVGPSFRRRGWGENLLCRVLDFSIGKGCGFCILRVRVGNYPAIALYEKQQFFVGRKLHRYFDKPYEDGFEMVCYLE
ncbi:MAG: GNAT family N-acetyltransferase [Candidatus Latescibacterota bacterium]|nr:GNAT family N-acetyltransferase [Candidatus Latescibacterota bacterium]